MGVTEKNLGSGVFLGSGSLSGGLGYSGSLSGGLHGSDGGEGGSLLGDKRTQVAMETTGDEDGEEPKSGTSQEEEIALRQVGALLASLKQRAYFGRSVCTSCSLAYQVDVMIVGSRGGELRVQKLKSHLVRTQSLNVLPLKPGVG